MPIMTVVLSKYCDHLVFFARWAGLTNFPGQFGEPVLPCQNISDYLIQIWFKNQDPLHNVLFVYYLFETFCHIFWNN